MSDSVTFFRSEIGKRPVVLCCLSIKHPGPRFASFRFTMILFAIYLSYSTLPFSLDLLVSIASISEDLHKLCQSGWKDTAHFSISAALICGREIQEVELRQLLIDSGLYHLVVVSGSHLAWIRQTIRKIKPNSPLWIEVILWVLYSLISHWQPPVVRALFQSVLEKTKASELSIVLFSWLTCLAIHPQWIHSLSLHLSVVAALAFQFGRPGAFALAARLWILMCPLLMGWSRLQPAVSFLGVLLAPMSLTLWFSTAAIEFFVPDGWTWMNELLNLWTLILKEVGNLQPPVEKIQLHTSDWAWLYTLFAYLFVHFRSISEKRRALR